MKEINENELKDVTGGSGAAVVGASDAAEGSSCPEGYVAKDGFCINLLQIKKKSDLKIIPR